MGNKDKVTAATKSQEKRVFNEHLYFSHPRLKAQTAAAFLQGERERCCCDHGWFRDHSGKPHLLSAPPVLLKMSCPSLSAWSDIVSRGWIWESLKTFSKAQLCQERLFRLLRQILTSLSFFSQRSCLKVLQMAPSAQGMVCSSQDPRDTHFCPKASSPALFLWAALALNPALTLRQLIQATLSPLPPLPLYFIPHLEEIWWDIFWEPFSRAYYPTGVLFRKMRKIL